MKFKALFSIVLITSFCGINAFAKTCLAPWEDLHDQYRKWTLNSCSSYVYANYKPMYMSQSDNICAGKGPAQTKCLIDITEKTKVLLRAPDRGLVLDGFDCPVYEQKIMNPATAARVCEVGTSDDYTTCVAELFQKGGLPLASDTKPSGLSLCRSGWKKDLNACIIQKYQSGRYSGEQAATECVIAYNGGTQGSSAVDSKMIDAAPDEAANAKAAQEARDVYNREQAKKRAAEAKKQQQQSSTRTPPASSSSSSGDVIEDLPSL